jgi:hypothetical protein
VLWLMNDDDEQIFSGCAIIGAAAW